MTETMPNFMAQTMKRTVRALLEVSTFRFAVLFLIVAVLVSIMIVLTIDLLWDGRLNAELEFAGVVTPFLDGLFLVVFVGAMLDEIREEMQLRKTMEEQVRKLNEELELKVQQRTRQLLEAQEELLQKEKLAVLGQVAGSVGHELRNPLGVMSNAVFYLQSVLPDANADVKEYLDIIRNEIAGSERIVSDLQDAVRTKPPRPEPVNVRELVAQALRKCAIPPTVAVALDIPGTLPGLLVDAVQMQQVLRNLVSNAVEAMPRGGELQISAREDRQAATVTVSVKDSGIGIAPEHVPKLFLPLFSTKARGIGLGLVVVKNLVEANGGIVQVESTPGNGSVFSVTLPTDGKERGRA